MPRVYVIGGPNGAGKTTAATALFPDALRCPEFVNADAIAAGISRSARNPWRWRPGASCLAGSAPGLGSTGLRLRNHHGLALLRPLPAGVPGLHRACSSYGCAHRISPYSASPAASLTHAFPTMSFMQALRPRHAELLESVRHSLEHGIAWTIQEKCLFLSPPEIRMVQLACMMRDLAQNP